MRLEQSSQRRKLEVSPGIQNSLCWERANIRKTVDRVLDTCFQLLSLFFMTIGRNNEAPAVYALTSTIKRLLDHLAEAVLYSAKDLDHIAHTIVNLRDIVKNAEGKYSPKLITLLSNRLALCQTLCDELQESLNRLDPCLQLLHEKLISILRLISLANTKTKNVCFLSKLMIISSFY